jgi:UDP-glucuronate 4-epimerase
MTKKILVTGGAGFIGSHLCEALVKEGHNVVAVDNFDPFYPREQKEEFIKWLKTQSNFTLVEADVRDREKMEEIFAEHKFEHIFHLAGRGGIRHSKENPYFYLDDIGMGSLVTLETAARHGVKSIVNASTSSVYAQTDGSASKENSDTDHPGSVYTAAKKASELLAHAYHVLYGMSVINVRFFSVYGPRCRQDMIIYRFSKKILSGEPILDFYPDPKRDFTYISDIVDGLIKTLDLPHNSYEVLNLGYGSPRAVTDSIRVLEEVFGKKAVMGERIETPASDMAVTNADTTRAQALLNWKPKVSLEEGVRLFAEWYLNNPQFIA